MQKGVLFIDIHMLLKIDNEYANYCIFQPFSVLFTQNKMKISLMQWFNSVFNPLDGF